MLHIHVYPTIKRMHIPHSEEHPNCAAVIQFSSSGERIWLHRRWGRPWNVNRAAGGSHLETRNCGLFLNKGCQRLLGVGKTVTDIYHEYLIINIIFLDRSLGLFKSICTDDLRRQTIMTVRWRGLHSLDRNFHILLAELRKYFFSLYPFPRDLLIDYQVGSEISTPTENWLVF